MNFQPKLDRLRKLVEARTVDCPDFGRYQEAHSLTRKCTTCNGTGRIPDPDYKAMLELVRERCFSCEGTTSPLRELGKPGSFVCGTCEGSSFSTRSWKGLPKGALAGALLTVFSDFPSLVEAGCRASGENYAHVQQIADKWFMEELGSIFDSHDPDEAALDAVIEAMESEGKGE